jgi:4'-phosphopantetheinyl transferase
MYRERLHQEIHIWTIAPESVRAPARLAQLQSILSDEELARFRRFRCEQTAQHYLVSHAMLRTALSRYADIAPPHWKFVYGSHGRPEIANQSVPRLRFNLTHTDGLAACIVSLDHACGIDAERLSERHDPLGVAGKMFSANEYGQLQQLSGQAHLQYFYDHWTLREAYGKARGVGLAFPTRKLEFFIYADGTISVGFAPDVEDGNCHWHFQLLRPTAEHVVAIALSQSDEHKPTVVVRNFVFDGNGSVTV